MQRSYSLEKTMMLRKIERRRGRGVTEDEMGGQQHQLSGHESVQTQGDSGGQGRKPGLMQSMGLQRARHNLVTEQQQQM